MRTGSVVGCAMAAFFSSVLPVLAQGRQGQQVQLPEGNGKELVQTTCSQCHALNLITNAGYSREEWPNVFGGMINLPKDKETIIADYLAKNFPDKPKPKAVIIPGNV